MRWLDNHDIAYEKIDVIADDAAFAEMVRLSGQELAPVLDVDGKVLADFGPEELPKFFVPSEHLHVMVCAVKLSVRLDNSCSCIAQALLAMGSRRSS